MHAKFVASESNIYEGSGNLTYFGLRVNVEVYNFYPRTYGRIYQYAITSYVDFLRTYLANFVDWKSGLRYLANANQLGTRVAEIADELRVKFNPKVTQEKIDILTKAREQLLCARSELWQLPGHKLLLNLDFSLSQASLVVRSVLMKMWAQREKEIDKEAVNIIEKDLDKASKGIKQVAPILKELKSESSEYLSWYEGEYLQKNLAEADRFKEYINKFKIEATE